MSNLFHAHGGSVFHVLSVIMTVQFHFLLMFMLIHVHVFHHVGSCRMIHAHLLVNGGVPECPTYLGASGIHVSDRTRKWAKSTRRLCLIHSWGL